MRRIIALLLILMTVFVMVGCGKEKRQIIKLTLSTEDSEAILAAAGIMLPDAETAAGANSTIKWLSWFDQFHNYSEDEVVNTGYFTFTEKYGGEIEWIECDYFERMNDLANLILAGNPPDFTPSGTNSTATYPMSCIKGQYQAIDQWIDYDDPLWSGLKETADYFTLGGEHYVIVFDLDSSNVIPYNRRVIDEWGFDDPADLYANDEWTWEAFLEMCIDFSDPDEDRYALDGWGYDNALMESSGTDIVTYDTEEQRFVSNLDDPRLERAANLIYELKRNDCIYPIWNNGWALRGGEEIEGVGIKDGLTLFWLRGTWAFTAPVAEINQVWGDIEAGELMFVPIPRDSEGDGNYYCTTKSNGYCMVKDGPNPEGVALLASCDRFKILDPTVVSVDKKQLIEVYKWSEEMLDMYDHTHDLANGEYSVLVYDAGLGTQLDSSVNSCKELGRLQEAQTWASIREGYAERLEYYVNELNEEVAAYGSGDE